MNTLRVRLQKLLATCVSALIPAREARHRVRYCLHPLNDRRCVAYFKRRYVERTPPAALPVERGREPSAGVEYIWQCWLQGEERMPALVRRCLDSVRRHAAPGQQVVLVTEANYADYVALPEGITALRRAGRIADALLLAFPAIISVDLSVTKVNPPMGAHCLGAGVEIHLINNKTR